MGTETALTNVLFVLAPLMAMAAVALLAGSAYSSFLESFIAEVRDDAAGGGLGDFAAAAVRRLGAYNRRFVWPGYDEYLRSNLIKAGEPFGYKPEDLLTLQLLSFMGGLLVGFVFSTLLGWNPAWSLLVGAMGLLYPVIWLSDQVTRRHLLISRALPFNLDLLTLAVEAGLDFTAALATVVEKGKSGPLRDELQLVLKQLKMGKTREEALKSMIARVQLPALTQFVTALIQADKMGTSLGKILRVQSMQLRIERTHRAEKLANEAPIKMLFPLIACIFPTVFLVLFGPIVFAFMFGNVIP